MTPPEVPSTIATPMDQTSQAQPDVLAASMQRVKSASLWRSPDFVKFWVGQSVSKLGDNFAQLALPLLVLQLTASPLALGFTDAAYFVPYLLLGLPAGALSDRLPRRRVMMICDGARALAYIALAALLVTGVLRRDTVWLVFLLQAVTGTATIFFDVGFLTAMPNIAAPDQLLAGNSAMQVSDSTSQLAGPPLAGAAFQAFGATIALVIDGVSFVVSFVSLALIPREFRATTPPQQAQTTAPKTSLRRDIGVGLRFVWGQPVLRWTMLLIAASNFFGNAIFPLLLFRMQHQFHYSGGLIGVVLAFGAAGGISGSIIAGRLRRWFGMLPIALVAEMVSSLEWLSFIFTDQAWVFMVVEFFVGIGNVVININILTLRQSITPDHLMGRMQSAARVLAWSLIPVGAIAGPALAIPFGVPTIIAVGCIIPALIGLAMFLSPIRAMG